MRNDGGGNIKPGDPVIFITKNRKRYPALVRRIRVKSVMLGMAPMIDLIHVRPKNCGMDEYGAQFKTERTVQHMYQKKRIERCWVKPRGPFISWSKRTGGGIVEIGNVVIYIDQLKQEHYALVTAVFSGYHGGDSESPYEPALNLVYVDSDPAKLDRYGRQIVRVSSIVHISDNSAKANCWTDIGTA